MDAFLDFWRLLFSPAGFTPRYNAGTSWTPTLAALYVVGTGGILLGGLLLPLVLTHHARREGLRLASNGYRRQFARIIASVSLLFLFGAGVAFVDALAFWVPLHRLSVLLRLLAAAASLWVAAGLWGMIPRALRAYQEREGLAQEAARVVAEVTAADPDDEERWRAIQAEAGRYAARYAARLREAQAGAAGAVGMESGR